MKRRTTIFLRTFSATAALLIASFVLLGSAASIIAMQSSRAEREDAMSVSAQNVAAVAASYAFGGTVYQHPTMSSAVALASELSGFQIVVVGRYGDVVATPDGVEREHTLYVSQQIMETVFDEGEYVAAGTLGGLYRENFFSVGTPVESRTGEQVGAVFVSVDSTAVRELMADFLRVFVMVAVIVLAAASVWAFFYTQRLTQPLGDMATASRSFARGDFSRRIEVEDDQVVEIHELATGLNRMAESLDRAESRRREFIANISHELKTPMTSISGYVDGILDGVIPPEKQDKYLGVVSRETKRLSRLVTQMLEVSRMESDEESPLNMTVFDLGETARQVVVGQERKITDKRLELLLDIDEHCDVLADRDAIYRVVFNLVDNAVKYSNDETPLEISVKKRAGRINFAVSDIGRPIPPEERERIFERFHKTDRSRRSEGLGLGLYLVRTILSRHGESVECITDGAKTTMRFSMNAVTR